MFEAVRGALQLMSGVTEVTVTRAREVATAIVAQGVSADPTGVVTEVSDLADELITTGRDNREMLLQTVRMEVDRAVNRMGFVREGELASVRRHVDRLEAELAAAQAELAQAREDAATTSIVVSAGSPDGSDVAEIAESVVDSARRIAAVTGALSAVPGLAGGPWARVARDLATSAAGIVSAASTARPAERSATKPAARTRSADTHAPSANPVDSEQAAPKTAGAKESPARKAPAKKASAKKAPAKKASAKKAPAKKASAKKASAKKAPAKKAPAKKAPSEAVAPAKAAAAVVDTPSATDAS
jgi:polyhydroxyalkanoate synthesis regulator phasin